MVMVSGSIVNSFQNIFLNFNPRKLMSEKKFLEKLTFSDREQKPKEGFCCITMGWVLICESNKNCCYEVICTTKDKHNTITLISMVIWKNGPAVGAVLKVCFLAKISRSLQFFNHCCMCLFVQKKSVERPCSSTSWNLKVPTSHHLQIFAILEYGYTDTLHCILHTAV